MFAIRPNDFYRCIMSPNMMLARTRPLPIQQGPFFIFLLPVSVCNCVSFSRLSQSLTDVSDWDSQRRLATNRTIGRKMRCSSFHTITACAQSAPPCAGQDSLPPFYCCRSGQENRPVTR
ncbi:hypothetical protein DSR96_07525 [Salmonella enterica subsp. houtenae]|nr:hypothetical protein [Salmonella enterica subsp. houtenae]